MEIAASYLVNYTTWNPSDFWCVLITILFLISFFQLLSFCWRERQTSYICFYKSWSWNTYFSRYMDIYLPN